MFNSFAPLSADTVAELDASDAADARSLAGKGRRRHYSASVTSRLPGPLCWEAFEVGISHAALLRTPGLLVPEETISNMIP